jgi:hypothetical protein
MPKKILFYGFFSFLICIFACEDSVPNYPAYPITLNVSNYADGPELSWTSIKSADFLRYRIWRTSNAKDTVPNNPVNGNDVFIIATGLTDFETTTFKDQNNGVFSSSTSDFYYRVEAVLKNRSVWSQNILIKDSDSEIGPNVESITIDKSNDNVFFIDGSSNVVAKFNSDQEKIINTLTLPSGTTTFVSILGKKGQKSELYVADYKTLYIIDPEAMKITETITLPVRVYEISTDNAGKIFFSTEDQLFIMDRNNANKTYSYPDLTNTFGLYRYYYIPQTDELLTVESSSPYTAAILQLDPTHTQKTGVIVQKELKTSGVNSDYSKNLIFNKNTFILGSRGLVYERQLNNLGKLNISSNGTSNLIFKTFRTVDDNTYLSFATNTFSGNAGTISTWKEPFTLQKENVLGSNLNPIDVLPMRNKTWLVYSKFTGVGKTYIGKIKN